MTDSKHNQWNSATAIAWQFTEQVPHSRDLGMQIISITKNQACIRLPPNPRLFVDDNTEEFCASVLYSLADSASGLAVLAEARDSSPIATLDLRVDYFQPAKGDRALLAVATCPKLTEEVAFIHCDIFHEGCHELLATANATFMRNTLGGRILANERA
ncbi:PaaI family thioesterase [Spongiibacter marinus]|jgi:uncharacterized protein (TIGR00369 family)|uniref:PaaI family thioesterase n=1 Tax=Spongiibacter marinus TaxID=354246 RepID=UPI00196050FD|nr:PaaI family thioesterase [Spongiibacter marinus]MBM7424806.1 uncharacterized protein (TIGR00369 family) [Spongiibacter marinus]